MGVGYCSLRIINTILILKVLALRVETTIEGAGLSNVSCKDKQIPSVLSLSVGSGSLK
jgi:hypothetical protein